jgi:hypothetical protein
MLLLSFSYNIIQDFTVLNGKCSCIWVITVTTVDIQTPLTFVSYFYSCVIQTFLSLPTVLYLTGKLGSMIFRKANKNELNLLLVSLSL